MSGTSATNPGNDVTSRNRTQQNPEPGYPGLHSGEEPPARLLAATMFCCLPLPGGRGLSRPQRETVWERGRRWLRDRTPPRGIWPFARRNRKGTREPQAGPGHLYRPTRVTLSPFPVSLGMGFLGVCLPQASPGRCGSQACGPGVSTPQGRVGMAGWGSPGSAGCPG